MPSAKVEPGYNLKLPLDQRWKSEDEYVQSLLKFVTSSDFFRTLCGGIHVLDFLTRKPDLYTTVLSQEWRTWFDKIEIDELLDLLLRKDLDQYSRGGENSSSPPPPQSLIEYVDTIRKHCLQRQFSPFHDSIDDIPRFISVGMKPKKIHEVANFAAYVDALSARVMEVVEEPLSIVDLGSGQNYLGRTLACPPYNKHVIAIERKHHNINGARSMDVHAKLVKKEKIMRNKKEYKRQLATMNDENQSEGPELASIGVPDVVFAARSEDSIELDATRGSMTYVEHDIQDARLENILYPDDHPNIEQLDLNDKDQYRPKVMVISLHSCGNLLHHGVRSLVLNPSVAAVAMIGCCYNLLTERLGPATYKLPQLRPNHPRLQETGSAYDPHGFPLSKTLETFAPDSKTQKGVRLNITARMMAVQAPYNWGPEDSEAFFRRHFYRALLQRMLLDRGVVHQSDDPDYIVGGNSLSGKDDKGTPLIVGSLRKACFTSFRAYIRGALAKLTSDADDGIAIAERTYDITDEVIDQYETKWGYAKKNLAVIWSLMAFSAGVVESVIAVDRWLFLREQDCVQDCWVEPVFDYGLSPRNLVVVGIKKLVKNENSAKRKDETR